MPHNHGYVPQVQHDNYMIFGEIPYIDMFHEVVVNITGLVIESDTELVKVVVVQPTGECDLNK